MNSDTNKKKSQTTLMKTAEQRNLPVPGPIDEG